MQSYILTWVNEIAIIGINEHQGQYTCALIDDWYFHII